MDHAGLGGLRIYLGRCQVIVVILGQAVVEWHDTMAASVSLFVSISLWVRSVKGLFQIAGVRARPIIVGDTR